MNPDTAENIFNDLPDKLKSAVTILSVSSSLTQKVAEELLQSAGHANGNASEIVRELKSLPVWIQRNRTSWAIDAGLREKALRNLNGSRLETKKEVLNILKEYQPDFNEYSYIESKDFQLQISRLALSIPEERDDAISSLRSFFDTAELFNNHESSRVISAYIDENLDIDKDENLEINKSEKQYSEAMLSAFFIRGLYAYRSKDKKTALKYLIPVWKKRGDSSSSIKDAAVAAHLVGLIYSKNRNRFGEAEKAYKESLELRIPVNDTHGLAQTYHSLGNLYSKYRNRFEKAKRAYQQSLEILEAINDTYGLAQVYHSLGNLYSEYQNRFEEAERVYQQSLDLGREINHTHHLAQVYHSIGNLYSKDPNRFEEAEQAYKQSLKILESTPDQYGLAQVYHSLGILYSKDQNHYEEAEQAYKQSVALGLKLRNVFHLAQVYMNFGKLRISQKRYPEARDLLNKSLKYERKEYYINQIKRLIRNLPV